MKIGHQASAYTAFPKEVWEIILEYIPDDTETILNTFEAFPEVKCLFKKKWLFNWMIGDVMPLILPKLLSFQDILACRLVSKRWNNAVTSTLANHPSRRPLKSGEGELVTRMHSTHFSYQGLPKLHTNFYRFFDNADLEIVKNQVIGWNPLLGGSLVISVADFKEEENQQREHLSVVMLTRAESFLNMFGHHVFHIQIDLGGIYEPSATEVIQRFLQCLCNLPNLKSLKVSRRVFECGMSDNVKQCFSDWAPPKRRDLESLDLSDVYDDAPNGNCNWHCQLVKVLANPAQLQKLVISIDKWQRDLGGLFKNLQELELHLKPALNSSDAFRSVFHILRDLKRFRSIRKLKVRNYDRKQGFSLNEILKCLVTSQIESLELIRMTSAKQHHNRRRYARENPVDVVGMVSSIQELIISDNAPLDYTFLKCLPALQYLMVTVDKTEVMSYLRPYGFINDGSLDSAVRCCFFYDPKDIGKYIMKVWTELPNLKLLTMTTRTGAVLRQYARECKSMFSFIPLMKGGSDDGYQEDIRSWMVYKMGRVIATNGDLSWI